MKKLFALILAVVMIFCVCGCNKSSGNLSSDEVETIVEVIDETQSGVVSGSDSAVTSTGSVNSSTSQNQSTASGNSAVKIDYNTVTEVDICDEVIRSYLEQTSASQQFFWLNSYSGQRYDYQYLELDWDLDYSSVYTVYFSENADFSNAMKVEAQTNILYNTTLVPGKTYYWKVIGTNSSDPLGGGRIKVKDAPTRWIQVDGTGNVRDMGGWTAENGKKVKYGMLYRGQKLDSVTQTGISTIKQLGLKTELDLRYASQKYQATGTGMNYVFLETNQQYDDIFNSDFTARDEVKTNYKKIFELLSDESNYPFYAHCSGGADRTGTYAFILNGVLGVSYEDLTRDFELTSFSSSGKRWRGSGAGNTFGENDTVMQDDDHNYVAWGELYKGMMEYGSRNGCTTLQSSIEHFLVNSVGVPQSQIQSFKNIMLG